MHSISLKEIPMVKLLVKHGAHVDAKTAKAAKMSWVKAIIDANADDGSGRGY
jgi:hypothetical protein